MTSVTALISSSFYLAPLFAQRISDLGRRFRHGGSSIDATQVTIFVVAIAALIGGAFVLSRYVNDKRPCNNPSKLFRELCGVHKLAWGERRLLSQVASSHQLESPALAFTDPNLFDTTKLHPSLKKRADQVQQLGKRIFG